MAGRESGERPVGSPRVDILIGLVSAIMCWGKVLGLQLVFAKPAVVLIAAARSTA
jgi:hypothetical protein